MQTIEETLIIPLSDVAALVNAGLCALLGTDYVDTKVQDNASEHVYFGSFEDFVTDQAPKLCAVAKAIDRHSEQLLDRGLVVDSFYFKNLRMSPLGTAVMMELVLIVIENERPKDEIVS